MNDPKDTSARRGSAVDRLNTLEKTRSSGSRKKEKRSEKTSHSRKPASNRKPVSKKPANEPKRVHVKVKEMREEPLYEEPSEEEEDLNELHREVVKERRSIRRKRAAQIALIAACCYVVFLIYGVFMTTYQYTDDGTIHPQMMSAEDIKAKKDYETVLVWYEKCRILYERILMLDYRLSAGEEDPLTLGPEYNALLEDSKDVNVSDLSVKIDALEVNAKYTAVKDMLYKWVSNDAALYLQYMSSAITKNDSDAGDNALVEKDTVYNDFSLITENIVTLGSEVKGVDLTDIQEWSPDSYVKEQVYGKDATTQATSEG